MNYFYLLTFILAVFGFQLGREWKLSIAELINIFPEAKIIYSASSILVLDGVSESEILKYAYKIGGTIKIFELQLLPDIESVNEFIAKTGAQSEGKFKYSLNLFGEKKLKLENLLKTSKYLLKNKGISARYFNKDNGKNLTSAQIIGNSILKKGYDFNLVDIGGIYYFGKTIWVQDIDAYSKRDIGKTTDMQIGMLPPKLCQMMINIGTPLDTSNGALKIYDPFVGLGTILIEALHMGCKEVFGSDINEKMIQISSENIEDFVEKQGIEANYSLMKLNAKYIDEAPFFSKKLDLIVTEGYLGEVMTKKNISIERINKQKESLIKIYESFFLHIRRTRFNGKIVICFPFWKLDKKYIYFSEILEIIKKNDFIVDKIFKNQDINVTTKVGSLLYKRDSQLVGREIFVLSLT